MAASADMSRQSGCSGVCARLHDVEGALQVAVGGERLAVGGEDSRSLGIVERAFCSTATAWSLRPIGEAPRRS